MWRSSASACPTALLYEQTVPEALLSCMVPKMMLQPLAENAILHGLSGVPDGKLTVEARELEDETLEIRVCDNGAGLPEALARPHTGRLRSRHGIWGF